MFAVQTKQAGRFTTFVTTADKAEAFEIKRSRVAQGFEARVIRTR
jgi:hypothetical protein